MNPSRLRSFLALHLAVLLFGAAGVFGKYIALSALSLVFGRTLFAALCLLPLVQWPALRQSIKWSGSMVSGALLALHWLTFFASLHYAAVAFGLMGFATYPIFVATLEPWLFKQPRQRRDIYVAVMVVLGLIVMVSDAKWQDGSLQAIGMGALSGLSFAFLTLTNRNQGKTASSIQIAFIQNSIACLLLLPMAIFEHELIKISLHTWILLAVLGVVFTALSHSMFAFSLQSLSASLVSITAALEPVYGMLLAYLVLDEVVSVRAFSGAAIVILTTSVASCLHRDSAVDTGFDLQV